MKDLKYYRENAEENYLTTPISVMRYIGELERYKNALLLFLIFCSVIMFFGGFFIGKDSKQNEIENRAKKIEKECYTETDLELIIFNEKQL